MSDRSFGQFLGTAGVIPALLGLYGEAHLNAQEPVSASPFVAEFSAAAGGSAADVEVATGPGTSRTIDLGNWFRMGVACESRVVGRLSARGSIAYALAGWGGSGTSDPEAAHTQEGDRWELGAGLSLLLVNTRRSLFTVDAGVRFFWGMDVRGQLQRDTLYNALTFRTYRLNYRPGLDPTAGLTWRFRLQEGSPFALLLGCGVEHYQVVFDDAEPGIANTSVTQDLLPLIETRSGWAWTMRLGFGVVI